MLDELVKTVSAASGLNEENIRIKIAEKQRELSGLVSEEGACHIIARELGVKLIRECKRLNIKNVIPGMQNVDIIGRIIKIFPAREFGNEKKGRVASIFVADETGPIRLSLWDSETDKISEFSVGDVIQIKGYVKDNLGEPEIRLGRYGSIEKITHEMPELKNLGGFERRTERIAIYEMKENQYCEIRACLISVFESNPFYSVCSKCGSRLKDDKCPEHGVVEPEYELVLTGIIDDGSDSIRAVFFRDNAEKVLGMAKNDAKKVVFGRGVPALIDKIELGVEFIFAGRVKKNMLFDRLEFIVNSIKNVDVKDEIEMMLNA
ncbi:MAG: OB-fold nucleic acid binding domain-containing protein [Candidatus Aenigmatarchaeota archaeon]